MDDEQKKQLLIGGGVLGAAALVYAVARRADASTGGWGDGGGASREGYSDSSLPVENAPDGIRLLTNTVKQYDQNFAARGTGRPLAVSDEISQDLRDRIRSSLIDIHNRISTQPSRGRDPLFGRRDLWPPQGVYPTPRSVAQVRAANQIDAPKLTRYFQQVMQIGTRN